MLTVLFAILPCALVAEEWIRILIHTETYMYHALFLLQMDG